MLTGWHALLERIFYQVADVPYDVPTALRALARTVTIVESCRFLTETDIALTLAILDGARGAEHDRAAVEIRFFVEESLAYLSCDFEPTREQLGAAVWGSFLILGVALSFGATGEPDVWFRYILACSLKWQQHVSDEDFLRFYWYVTSVLGPLLDVPGE